MMTQTRVVAITDHGKCYVFDSVEKMFASADRRVTLGGEKRTEGWVRDKLGKNEMIEWLKIDGLTFETVRLATKIDPPSNKRKA